MQLMEKFRKIDVALWKINVAYGKQASLMGEGSYFRACMKNSGQLMQRVTGGKNTSQLRDTVQDTEDRTSAFIKVVL